MLFATRCSAFKPQLSNKTTNVAPLIGHTATHNLLRTSRVACSAIAVGIDLGTTNSAVAVLRDGEAFPTIIKDDTGCFTVPSIVAYDAAGRPLVGQQAKQQAVSNPLNTYYSVKRLIGRQSNEVQGLGLVYGLRADDQGGVRLLCPATDSCLTPQQVRGLQAGGLEGRTMYNQPTSYCNQISLQLAKYLSVLGVLVVGVSKKRAASIQPCKSKEYYVAALELPARLGAPAATDGAAAVAQSSSWVRAL